ncbi:MAG: SAV_2336 N-terminal domain-related protein [Cyanobacteria bacterium P01_F01_bin.150]
MINQLVAALGQELDLTSHEIADVIWLALQIDATSSIVDGERNISGLKSSTRNEPKRSQFQEPSDPFSDPEVLEDDIEELDAELHTTDAQIADADGLVDGLPIRVPNARSLREPLSLAKSLKPLLKKIMAGWSTVLDETATVERIADEGIWLPVLKPELEPWLDLALVVDESLSMHLWQQTVTELQRLLANYGVFRDVRVWSLVTDDQGEVRLRPRRWAVSQQHALYRPSTLIDPRARRLILIATDCVSPMWQDGSVLPALKVWAKSGPMAIAQMLPEWLWARTCLGFAADVRLHSLTPGAANQQLDVRDISPWDEVDIEEGIRVPAMTLEPEPFVNWAEMVSAKSGSWAPGFIFELGAIPSQEIVSPQNPLSPKNAEERVQGFRATASPMARRLANLLAAAPVINLPIVRIICAQLLPQAKQIQVAEVFLGGLLRQIKATELLTNTETIQYDFFDGVRENLLESLPTGDSLNVLEEVSNFVADRLGVSLETFLAALIKPTHTTEEEFLNNQVRSFARVASQVLRQLGGKYAQLAKELGQTHLEKKLHQTVKKTKVPEFALAIGLLDGARAEHYAVWVTASPFPGGYVHHDCQWTSALTRIWRSWQETFSTIMVEFIYDDSSNSISNLELERSKTGYSSRIMQTLGTELWQFIFDDSIKKSLDKSQGLALGQGNPLRFRLDIRDAHLVGLPWEIMQQEPGIQTVSLNSNTLFSRTISDVEPLEKLRTEESLNILLVLGQIKNNGDDNESQKMSQPSSSVETAYLNLEQDVEALVQVLKHSSGKQFGQLGILSASCSVDTLIQPTPTELVSCLEGGAYNVFFYAGAGLSNSNSGLIYLQSEATINGSELAQVLTRSQIKLVMFNTCWSTQPDKDENKQPIPRSSLAEVLVSRGVPSVLAMRDTVADAEALSFIEAFTQALVERLPIDQAVAIARQQLLTLYKFNQPAWTLPILYMHPEFDGELIRPLGEEPNEIPNNLPAFLDRKAPIAYLRLLEHATQTWSILAGMMKIGTWEGNDCVLQGPGISRKHAEIFYRDSVSELVSPSYYLRDFSRYGTLMQVKDDWQRIHRREILLSNGTQLKFGSHRSPTLEFIVEAE